MPTKKRNPDRVRTRFGPTKNGVRLDNATKQYVLNKRIAGRTYNTPTGQTEFRAAVEFAERFATERRALRNAADAVADPNAAMSVVIEKFKFGVTNMRVTEAQKELLNHCLNAVLRHWPKVPNVNGKPRPNFESLRPAQISLDDLNAWKTYVLDVVELSDSYVNKIVSQVLKPLFARCVDYGLIAENRNPTRNFKRERNSYEVKDIRSLADIEKVLTTLGGHNALVREIIADPRYRKGQTQTNWQKAFTENPEWQRALCGDLMADKHLGDNERTLKIRARVAYYTKRAKQGVENDGRQQAIKDLVEGLAFTGLRIGEANALRVEHVDLTHQVLRLNKTVAEGGAAEKGGKRILPINHPRQFALFSRLVAGKSAKDPVFDVKSADHALKRACADAGVPKITHHGLRHFFASWCLLRQIDLPTVAEWLGHKDNGALAGRLYCHILDELRVRRMAKNESQLHPVNVIPLPTAKAAHEMSVTELEAVLRSKRAQEEAALTLNEA